MKELGLILREAREAKGLSLAEVHERTRISSRYLEAIEEGNFAVLPGDVYIKGFLQNYADCVGLDGGIITEKYKQLKAEKEAAEEERRRIEALSREQARRVARPAGLKLLASWDRLHRSTKILLVSGIVAFLFFLLLTGYLFLSTRNIPAAESILRPGAVSLGYHG